jgi:putative transposase
MRHTVAPPSTLVACSQLHENSSFPASLGYVFVLLEVGTRRISHFNVTANPTATWTLQQFREVMMDAPSRRFVLHDRDRIYSSELDSALQAMGLKVLKTPFQAPQANASCESFMKTLKREEIYANNYNDLEHLRANIEEFIEQYYNRLRLHSAPGYRSPEEFEKAVPIEKVLSFAHWKDFLSCS